MSVIIISALWCNACLFMKKTFKAFQTAHPELTFHFYDFDLDDEAETYAHTKVLPLIIFEYEGKEVHRLEGEMTLAQLEEGLLDASKN